MSFERLYEDWQKEHEFSAFIRDGIVDESHYEEPHVLFVLRDMNCQTECDLREQLSSHGSGWKTWNNIGRWTKALLDGDENYPADMSEANRVEQVKRIAVMNLKKEGGVSRTSGSELLNAVQTQHEYIYKEICLCNPSIIICCGLPMKGCISNADLLWNYVFTDRTEWEKFSSANLPHDWWFYEATINGKKIPIISFCHPQTTNLCGRRGHNDLFEPLYRDMLYIRERFIVKKGGLVDAKRI